VLDSALPDDPALQELVVDYFPPPLRESYGPQMREHRLRRELIATLVANQLVDRAGMTFAFRLGEETGAAPAQLARAYAVARAFSPLLINTVVGFIGPEYLYDGKQIIRAGLEDHFCGKLLGLPMGCDVCYTNHSETDQDDMDVLLTLLGAAGVNYIMGVPGADDVMLHYQSTSFHDALYLRRLLGLRPAPEFEAWLRSDARLQLNVPAFFS